ncbi:hypothetical protein [Flagellimonas baculiformis]|uniref:hypothetical protein n=1 Tax=Flagellimonas baculiformis TaxID=3067310 RepID=UPI00296F8D93|nr:hypothetical protein [Muricauda sp. D6]
MKRFLFLTLVCLLSCNAQKHLGKEIEGLVVLEQDGYSGVGAFEAREIRDTKSLNKFYSQINRTRKPGLPVPMVDFSQEMVLLICLGEQQGQKSLRLSKIKETETEFVVGILMDGKTGKPEETKPITTPFYLYKMPLTDKAIVFQQVD